jgi:predicted enzyme related to lactoylglutathione lyase
MEHEMTTPRDAITWFEIPVRELDRAQRFYEVVLGRPMTRETMGSEQFAMFAAADSGVKGCLNIGAEAVAPSAAGTRVYLDAAPSLDAALARVPGAGGRVVTPKVALPEGMGWFAHIADSEGNVVGLHALA